MVRYRVGTYHSDMPESRVSQVCRQEVERMRKALFLMETGVMTTSEVRQGRPEDTTQETMDLYRLSIANLEPFIENVGA
jgi:hypothetical protein